MIGSSIVRAYQLYERGYCACPRVFVAEALQHPTPHMPIHPSDVYTCTTKLNMILIGGTSSAELQICLFVWAQ